jgi:tetratricopeptide (TPR) repeat protein
LLVRGMALYRSGKYDEAIKQLVEAREKASPANDGASECMSQLFLAMSYARLNNAAQAREEFDKGARLVPPDDKDLGDFWHGWIPVQVIHREAEAVLNGRSPIIVKASPEPAPVVSTIDEAFDLARARRTREAAPALRRFLMADPASPDLQWLQLVILDLTNADSASYRKDAEEMFKRFAQTSDPWAQERLAKACLLGPEPFELAQTTALAQSSSAARANEKMGEWAMFVYGLALYRSGRYDEAIKQLVETRDKSSSEHNEANECMSQLFLAMAHARLKHNAQARVEFDRGARLILSDSPADFGSSWHDWYAAQLVRREAEALLKSPAK